MSATSIQDELRRKQILIADDSEINRSMLADMLGEEYDILEAEDGVRALAILQKYGTEIDLVLLDIVMPHVNGFDVLSAMKKNTPLFYRLPSARGRSHGRIISIIIAGFCVRGKGLERKKPSRPP